MSLESTPRPASYIGVSGVVSPEQQHWIRQALQPAVAEGRHILLGVKAVHNTQWCDRENKYGSDHYPVGDQITGSLKAPTDYEMGIAQVYLDLKEAREQGIRNYKERFIEKLLARSASWLTGIQFDMLPWHHYDQSDFLQYVSTEVPEILLQCYGGMMRTKNPEQIAETLKAYQGLVTHVLFDASHGRGKVLDVEALKPYVEAASMLEGISVGVAGGLNADVIRSPEFRSLLEQYPHLSFDAEGGLRQDKKGLLDRKLTEAYLNAASSLVAS